MREQKYLYHYTSIETLALILEKRTIRFSSLKTVDDISESTTEDFGEAGRFCFVSCWTDMNEESIPLWKMYTPDMTGVRIKLPIRPFKKYKINKGNDYNTKDLYSYINKEKHDSKGGKGCIVSPISDEKFIFKVCYTKDPSLIFPKVYKYERTQGGYNRSISTENIGKYKDSVWKFQEEWRYKIFFLPWTMDEMANVKSTEEVDKFIDRIKEDNLSFNYYDLELDDEKFKDMEILVGPKASYAQKIIIESLVDKYNKGAKVEYSSLSIR